MLALLLLPIDSPVALALGLFLLLVFSAVGLPLPEEITLLLGGYLAYLEFLDYGTAVTALLAGIIVGDMVGYLLGRTAGKWIIEHILSHSRHALKILEKAKDYFDRHGEKVVFFSRPLIGVRVAVPMLAGHFHMNFAKFFLYDTIAAIPWTFFLVTLSYYLGSGLDLIVEAKEIKHAVFVTLGIVILLYACIRIIKNSDKH